MSRDILHWVYLRVENGWVPPCLWVVWPAPWVCMQQLMADDGLLPAKIHTLHPRFKTPYISIIICAAVVSFMILWSFQELIIIDVTLYGAGLFLEFVTLIKLRITAPDAHRPFRIPLNTPWLFVMLLLPFTVFTIALCGAFS